MMAMVAALWRSSSAVTGGNTVPSITSTAVTLVNEDSAYNYTFTATDNEGDTLILSAPTLPGWMSFNAGTGVLSGTPTNADVGTIAWYCESTMAR